MYSSTAKGNATAASDIDLLVVSDSLTLEDLYRHLAGAESYLARPINPTLYTAEEFLKRLREGNVFLKRLLDDETLLLKGSLPDGE